MEELFGVRESGSANLQPASCDVLIVEDEAAFAEFVRRELERAGYRARCAPDGRRAIDAAIEAPPDALICDWILPGDLHGLHVAEAVRTLRPDVAVVLNTGFAAPDVAALAENKRIASFLEKPFEPAQLLEALDAARKMHYEAPTGGLGAVELDDHGGVERCTPNAAALLTAAAGAAPGNFAECFDPPTLPALGAGRRGWLAVRPAGDGPGWELRARPRQRGGWLVLLRQEDSGRFTGATERMAGLLMADEPSAAPRCPYNGRVMVVDDEDLIRRVVINVFERMGCVWHAAETHARAVELIERDPNIEFIFLDYDMPDGRVADVVPRIRTLRPDVTIVGTSGRDRRREFAELGVSRFLPKPWRANDLVAELIGRIESCPLCQTPLPLRHARRGERAKRWECRGCGRRFEGVLDADADDGTRPNAVPKS